MFMRVNPRLILAASFLTGICSLASSAPLPPLVHQAAPGVYYRQPEDEKRIIATTSWIEFQDFTVVVDANFPWGARAILQDIRQTTQKPVKFVFDTHYHADHSYGNGVFAAEGATIISSDETAVDSRERNTSAWNKSTDTGDFNLKQYSLVHPQLTFQDRVAIDDGHRRLELIHVGPAHTRGDAVAWLPNERILFAGDLCTTRAQNNLSDPGMSPSGWLTVLDRLMQMNPAIVIPGHGVQGTVESLRGQRAYLAAVFEGVRDGIKRGATPEELQKSIDLSNYTPWSDNAARNSAAILAAYRKLNETASNTRSSPARVR